MPKHPKALEAEQALAAARLQQQPAAVLPAAPQPQPPPAPGPVSPTPPPPAPVPSLPTPAQPATEDAATLRHRLSTMDGILKRDREQHARELAEERSRNEAMQAQLAELQQRINSAQVSVQDTFLEEQITDLGEESLGKILKSLDKVVERRVEAQLAPVRQRQEASERIETSRRQTEAQLARQRFAEEITAAVPTWKEWAVAEKVDPRFAEWLLKRPSGSRFTRQQLLTDAHEHLDSTAVIEMLQEFQGSLGAAPPANPNSRILPTGAGSGDAPPPPTSVQFSKAQVDQFRKDLQQGKYRGRAGEAADLHRRIIEAFKKGAVI